MKTQAVGIKYATGEWPLSCSSGVGFLLWGSWALLPLRG